MLNVGISELLVFAIIALLVLGPEKLPEGARFAGKWYGKIKRFIGKVQNEIDQELKLSEFREEMRKEIDRLTALEIRMHQQLDALKHKHLADMTDLNPTLSGLNQLSYQQFNQILTPYSTHFIQLHLPKIQRLKSITQELTPLKIAV